MLDICLLGTGGTMPLPERWLTALMVRCGGSQLLIDCGEGTQIAARCAGWSFMHIDTICFTHFHADHIAGLPGLLLSTGLSGRTEPVHIIGPEGIAQVVESLRVIAPILPFELICTELTQERHEITLPQFTLEAFRVDHSVTCYGYNVILKRAGRFDAAKATQYGLPKPFWGRLQKGETIVYEGKTFTPDMVSGAARKGLKVTYCTDTRPLPIIAQAAANADLFICEGMYGDNTEADKAVEKKHMTFPEAAQLAREAQAKELWLTHFSPSLDNPEDYMGEVRSIFPNAKPGEDAMHTTLKYDPADK